MMIDTASIDRRQVARGAASAIALVLVGCGGPAREVPPAATPAAAATWSNRGVGRWGGAGAGGGAVEVTLRRPKPVAN